MSHDVQEYARGEISGLGRRFPGLSGAVRMLGIPKDKKRETLGPVPGGKFWAVHNRNDLPNYENGVFMPWDEFFEIHGEAWWQPVGGDGKPLAPWARFSSPDELPEIEVKRSARSSMNHLGEYEDYEEVRYEPLVQIYATYRPGTDNPYKRLRLRARSGGKLEFRTWLEDVEDRYSAATTDALCRFVKERGREPSPQPSAGSATASGRLSYDVDHVEQELHRHLMAKRSGREPVLPSDLEALRRHGMDGLFDRQIWDYEARRSQNELRVRQLAAFYLRGDQRRYPSRKSKDPAEKALAGWLQSKRHSYAGPGEAAKYPGEVELGSSLGLPVDWHIRQVTKDSLQRAREDKLLALADFYLRQSPPRLPRADSKDPEEKGLGLWLMGRQDAAAGRNKMYAYEGEAQLGTSLGLPEDWLDPNMHTLNARRSRNADSVRRLADFYRKRGYPKHRSEGEEKFLAGFLNARRNAAAGRNRLSSYEGEEELGISLGLPRNWLAPTRQRRPKKTGQGGYLETRPKPTDQLR